RASTAATANGNGKIDTKHLPTQHLPFAQKHHLRLSIKIPKPSFPRTYIPSFPRKWGSRT
ncbi:TPA: hypothetical protein ACJJO6_002197, partial [Neisseria meningitidis]